MELLQHPLISELRYHKWHCIAFPLFLVKFVTYAVYLALLTVHILLLPNPAGDTCARESKRICFAYIYAITLEMIYTHNNTSDTTIIVNTETRLDYQLTVVNHNQLHIYSTKILQLVLRYLNPDSFR